MVIGGLISSTLLTLVLIPTLYTMAETRRERRHDKRRKGQVAAAEQPRTQPVVPAH